MRRAAGIGLGLALAAAAACDAPKPAAPPPAPSPRPAAPAAPPAASGATPAAAEALPAPGSVRVEQRGERFDVLANQVPALDILAELASAADFATEVAGAQLSATPRTLALRDAPLERALGAILAGTPYAARYEAGARGAMALARVRVGALPPEPSSAPEAKPVAGASSGGAHGKSRAWRTGDGPDRLGSDPAERERLREAAAERDQERSDTIERQWQDPRPEERLAAIGEMDAQGDDRDRLAQMLHGDSSPEVRAAAAEALADGDAFQVMDDLLGALDDPDPRVVAASVRSLEDVYDDAPNPKIREKVMALKDAGDPEVRDAVASFGEWIE